MKRRWIKWDNLVVEYLTRIQTLMDQDGMRYKVNGGRKGTERQDFM